MKAERKEQRKRERREQRKREKRELKARGILPKRKEKLTEEEKQRRVEERQKRRAAKLLEKAKKREEKRQLKVGLGFLRVVDLYVTHIIGSFGIRGHRKVGVWVKSEVNDSRVLLELLGRMIFLSILMSDFEV